MQPTDTDIANLGMAQLMAEQVDDYESLAYWLKMAKVVPHDAIHVMLSECQGGRKPAALLVHLLKQFAKGKSHES